MISIHETGDTRLTCRRLFVLTCEFGCARRLLTPTARSLSVNARHLVSDTGPVKNTVQYMHGVILSQNLVHVSKSYGFSSVLVL